MTEPEFKVGDEVRILGSPKWNAETRQRLVGRLAVVTSSHPAVDGDGPYYHLDVEATPTQPSEKQVVVWEIYLDVGHGLGFRQTIYQAFRQGLKGGNE